MMLCLPGSWESYYKSWLVNVTFLTGAFENWSSGCKRLPMTQGSSHAGSWPPLFYLRGWGTGSSGCKYLPLAIPFVFSRIFRAAATSLLTSITKSVVDASWRSFNFYVYIRFVYLVSRDSPVTEIVTVLHLWRFRFVYLVSRDSPLTEIVTVLHLWRFVV